MPFRASEPPERGLRRRCFNPYSPVSSQLWPTAGGKPPERVPRPSEMDCFCFSYGCRGWELWREILVERNDTRGGSVRAPRRHGLWADQGVYDGCCAEKGHYGGLFRVRCPSAIMCCEWKPVWPPGRDAPQLPKAPGQARACCLGLGLGLEGPAHQSKLVRLGLGGPPISATSIARPWGRWLARLPKPRSCTSGAGQITSSD